MTDWVILGLSNIASASNIENIVWNDMITDPIMLFFELAPLLIQVLQNGLPSKTIICLKGMENDCELPGRLPPSKACNSWDDMTSDQSEGCSQAMVNNFTIICRYAITPLCGRIL